MAFNFFFIFNLVIMIWNFNFHFMDKIMSIEIRHIHFHSACAQWLFPLFENFLINVSVVSVSRKKTLTKNGSEI